MESEVTNSMPVGVTLLINNPYLLNESNVLKLDSELRKDFDSDRHDVAFDPDKAIEIERTDARDNFLPSGFYGGQWLRLNCHLEFYGVGYERGDCELIVRLMDWLESRLPSSHIYYGEDVTSMKACKPFDKERRDKLLRYFYLVGSEPCYTKDESRAKALRAMYEQV